MKMNASICEMKIIKKEILKSTHYFYKIINDETEFPPFHQALKAKQNITAMDIGCSFPAALIMLNEKYNLSKAICIDECSEETVVQNAIDELNKSWQAKTVSEFYFKAGGGCMKTVEHFDKVFSKYSFWGVSAEYALINNAEKVDILICQNFLHLWAEVKEHETWLNYFSSATQNDAVIVFSVQTKPWFEYEVFKSTLLKYYNGTLFEFYINGVWNNSYFINLK